MATATQSSTDPGQWEGRLILHDVGWNEYEAMLDIVGELHIRVFQLVKPDGDLRRPQGSRGVAL